MTRIEQVYGSQIDAEGYVLADHEDEDGATLWARPIPDGEPTTVAVVVAAWVFATGLALLAWGAVWAIGALIYAFS